MGGELLGTYILITGFCGLTKKPTERQKAIDQEIADIPNTYVFLNDILIVTNGKHYKTVKLFFEKTQHPNKQGNLYIRPGTNRIVEVLTQNRKYPINSKVQANMEKLKSWNLT